MNTTLACSFDFSVMNVVVSIIVATVDTDKQTELYLKAHLHESCTNQIHTNVMKP